MDVEDNFHKDEIERMKELARKLSRKIEQDKVTNILKSEDSRPGSDAISKESQSAQSTSDKSHKTTKSVAPSQTQETSYGTVSADMNKLKHFRIKKKPSTTSMAADLPHVENPSSKPVESEHKVSDKMNTLKRKSSSEQEERKGKHKKKKHKKKDASKCSNLNEIYFVNKSSSIVSITHVSRLRKHCISRYNGVRSI